MSKEAKFYIAKVLNYTLRKLTLPVPRIDRVLSKNPFSLPVILQIFFSRDVIGRDLPYSENPPTFQRIDFANAVGKE